MANYPMPAIGGPQYRRFAEMDPIFAVTEVKYLDGGIDRNIDAATYTRIFQIDYDSLTEAEAATIDAFVISMNGNATGFTLTTPTAATPSAEILSNVHFQSWPRTAHDIRGLQVRSVTLIKSPV